MFHKHRSGGESLRFHKTSSDAQNKLFCGFMQWPHAGRAALLTRGRFAQAGGR